MSLINIYQLQMKVLASNFKNDTSIGIRISDIAMIEKNLQALFSRNVNEIYLKTKSTNDECHKQYGTILCKLKRDFIYMKQTKLLANTIIEYQYNIKCDELFKNNTRVTGEDKVIFFKCLVKVIEWADAKTFDVNFK